MAYPPELAADQLRETALVSALQRHFTVPVEAAVVMAAERSVAGEDQPQLRRRITLYLIELSARLRIELPRVTVAGVDYEMKFRDKFGFREKHGWEPEHPSLYVNGEELIDINNLETVMWRVLGKHSSLPAYRDALIGGGIDILTASDINQAFGHREGAERSFGLHYMEVIDAFTRAAMSMVDPAGRRLAVELRSALTTSDLPVSGDLATKLSAAQVDAIGRVVGRDINLQERLDILETLCQVIRGDRILMRTAMEEFGRMAASVGQSYHGYTFKYGANGLKVRRNRVVVVGAPSRKLQYTFKSRWWNRRLSIPFSFERKANREQTRDALRTMLASAPRLITAVQNVASENGALRAVTGRALDRTVQR